MRVASVVISILLALKMVVGKKNTCVGVKIKVSEISEGLAIAARGFSAHLRFINPETDDKNIKML